MTGCLVSGARLRQDEAGRLFVDSSNAGFNFRTSTNHNLWLRDVLQAFARPPAPEFEPLNACAEEFVEQLDSTGILAARSPLFGLVLTKVVDGSVLGLSLPHTLAGRHRWLRWGGHAYGRGLKAERSLCSNSSNLITQTSSILVALMLQSFSNILLP